MIDNLSFFWFILLRMVNILKAIYLSWRSESPASYPGLCLTKGFPLVQPLTDFERSITLSCQLILKTVQLMVGSI